MPLLYEKIDLPSRLGVLSSDRARLHHPIVVPRKQMVELNAISEILNEPTVLAARKVLFAENVMEICLECVGESLAKGRCETQGSTP